MYTQVHAAVDAHHTRVMQPTGVVHRLLVLVDGSHAMEPHYGSLRRTVLQPLAELFHKTHAGAGHSHTAAGVESSVEYCVVVYRSSPFVSVSGWTHDVMRLEYWLDMVDFEVGGPTGDALVEGLHHAWLQFMPRKDKADNHLLLLSASDPAGLPCVAWNGHGEKKEAELLQTLGLLSVRCSLVSPMQRPRLIGMFAEAKVSAKAVAATGQALVLLCGLEMAAPKPAVVKQEAAAASTAASAPAATRQQAMSVWSGRVHWEEAGQPVSVRIEMTALNGPKHYHNTAAWKENLTVARFVQPQHIPDIVSILKSYARFKVNASREDYGKLMKLLAQWKGAGRMGVVPVSPTLNLCMFPVQTHLQAIILETAKLPALPPPAAGPGYHPQPYLPQGLNNSYNSARQFVQKRQ